MKELRLGPKTESLHFTEMIFTPKQWEKFKKAGDNELYKKFNKHADYEELRVFFNGNSLDLEAHCIKGKKK